jgi:VanZ family protein
MTSEASLRAARWLLAVVLFLIVYGSLYPFRFQDAGVHDLPGLLARLPWARTTRSDIAANVLLYLPFGACLGWMLASRVGGLLTLMLAALAGIALSLGIEIAQIYETRRVASFADVAYNGTGALAGSALALVLLAARHGLQRNALVDVLAQPIATALLLLWAGYRLAPFGIALSPAEWRAAVVPLLAGPWFAPWEIVRHLIPWLVVAQAIRSLLPGRDEWTGLAVTMLAVLAGLVVVAGKTVVPAEIVAMALALALTRIFGQFEASRVAALLAWALAALIVVDGLAPFNFGVGPDPFGLVPFQDSLTRYRATNLGDLLYRCFAYGALVWLLVRAGHRALLATVMAGVLVLAVEVLQAWLPGKSGDVTDPLLVVAAGGLLAMFEGPTAPRARQRRSY